ncbi:MAG TPA: allophanate hydrolase [Bordetella sp.]
MPKHSTATPAAAWIDKFPQALSGAAQGPLAGLRFAAKDNIDVAGVPTTAACPAYATTPAAHAAVVARLLAAGAGLAGKTNLDQFACGLNGTRSPYGAVPNAFDAAYVSGGSSSGSAYAVARGEVDFALGTDTAGSGRVPAGLNNIVGLKPSKGLVSMHGVLPAAQSVDCVSIFARTVAMAVRVLEVAMGYDARDPYSRPMALAAQALPARFRFGVPAAPEFFGDALARAAFGLAVEQLRALGGTPVPIDYTPLAEAAGLLYESALVAERYAAIRDFFDASPDAVIEPVRTIVGAGTRYAAADVFDAQHRLQALGQQARALWQGMDILCVPTAPTHCTIDAMLAEPVLRNRELGYYTNFVNLLDYAALSVPASLRPDGLPFGVTLIGQAGSDWQLAELGQRLHHASGLTQGATGEPLPEPEPVAALRPTAATHLPLVVVGAHLSGLSLNGQLTELGASLAEAVRTAPRYRLYALPGAAPRRPGLRRVGEGGASIAAEVWQVPLAAVGRFLAQVPPPLGLGSVEVADGRWLHGFICEGHAFDGAEDVSRHGGWRAYLASMP